MSSDTNWDIEKYKEEHESDEHWELRRAFMLRWKDDYPEERLVCLARVFTNMEFMGCRYPAELMHEVAGLSAQVAKSYRDARKDKLKRTFVSASTAAEDRAKGVKRKSGVVNDEPATKSTKTHINSSFVRSGTEVPADRNRTKSPDNRTSSPDTFVNETDETKTDQQEECGDDKIRSNVNYEEYLENMSKIDCLDVNNFNDSMFNTSFGPFVLLIRPWARRLCNIQASCAACGVSMQSSFEDGQCSLFINGQLIGRANGDTKQSAKASVENLAWKRLCEEAISIVFKEQWIAQGDARISVDDVSGHGRRGPKADMFGKPVENSVATKMMKLMGWKGGGLGADAQGIAEPIKPHMQMVDRSGLGSTVKNINGLRRAAFQLMDRYIASDTVDVDLVFSSDFTKEERAALHSCAQRRGLASRSYGDRDRFLVVRKKLDPFSLIRAVIAKGGVTPKYHVFIPSALQNGRSIDNGNEGPARTVRGNPESGRKHGSM